MARPSLRVLQVISGEQVEACKKNSENSDNLMKINKNMAKLVSKISAKNSATLLSPKISAINLCRNQKVDHEGESNSQPKYPAILILPLAPRRLPTTQTQLFIIVRLYACIKYRFIEYILNVS